MDEIHTCTYTHKHTYTHTRTRVLRNDGAPRKILAPYTTYINM